MVDVESLHDNEENGCQLHLEFVVNLVRLGDLFDLRFKDIVERLPLSVHVQQRCSV